MCDCFSACDLAFDIMKGLINKSDYNEFFTWMVKLPYDGIVGKEFFDD